MLLLLPVQERLGLRSHDFLSVFAADGLVQTLAEGIRTFKPEAIRLKNVHGSLDAVLLSSVVTLTRSSHLVILHDKEEASYFYNDLQNLLGQREILFFPMSYRRPYEYDETENANVLMRSETLRKLGNDEAGQIIVTYPEALSEKVINRKSLANNTFIVNKGDKLDRAFLEEFLHTYEFEKTDFVFEAGQFSIRGGIIDVFSFAHELPYRIELFGDEVDSIRSFDPGSQLSVDQLGTVSLMPDVQTRLVQEQRQSLLEFIKPQTRIWIKDAELLLDVLQKSFDKASAAFDTILHNSGNAKVALTPDALFESAEHFEKGLTAFQRVEFGSRFLFTAATQVEYHSATQPSFNKNFELLAKNLVEHQQKGYRNFICADQTKQLERLQGIFEEIHPELGFETLETSLRQGFVDHNLKIVCYTDHQIFERFHRYRAKEKFSKSKAMTFRELQTLQPGDFVTHIDYGIGKFAGLEKKEVNGKEQEAIRLVFRDDDMLYINIHALHKISKYSGKEGTPPAISKLGSGEWEGKKARVKRQLKDIARELIDLYAKRKTAPGHSFASDGFLQAELSTLR